MWWDITTSVGQTCQWLTDLHWPVWPCGVNDGQWHVTFDYYTFKQMFGKQKGNKTVILTVTPHTSSISTIYIIAFIGHITSHILIAYYYLLYILYILYWSIMHFLPHSWAFPPTFLQEWVTGKVWPSWNPTPESTDPSVRNIDLAQPLMNLIDGWVWPRSMPTLIITVSETSLILLWQSLNNISRCEPMHDS